METKREGLCELIHKVQNHEILLPDFQRNFTWKEEDAQKRIVASVLAQMPIGSILLLKGNSDEYAYKMMGSKERKTSEELGLDHNKEIMALLDGQQRMTVLSNVFSNIIFDTTTRKNLVPALKRRFFLALPKYNNRKCSMQNFNIHNLQFPKWNFNEPDFLSSDIEENIIVLPFKVSDDKFYNPFSSKKYTFADCVKECTIGNHYLIPLYMLVETNDNNINKTYLSEILKGIIDNIILDIVYEYESITDESDQQTFISSKLNSTYRENYEVNDTDSFRNALREQGSVWISDMQNYLTRCLEQIQLQEIIVDKANRSRAINIYENLNISGIRLGTFELIMARVATRSKENYYDRLVANIKNGGASYPWETFSAGVVNKTELVDYITKGQYVAAKELGCINDNDEIVSAYIDAYLNILSLLANFPDYNVESLTVDYIKNKKILEISSDDLDQLCDSVCIALDRALFFFQMRCGIRNIKEINYKLMLVAVGYIFSREGLYHSKQVHDSLEAWYWSSIFSGYFNSDQNSNIIKDIKLLLKAITGNGDYNFLNERKNQVLKTRNFSDKGFWLMDNIEETEAYPKDFLKSAVCQFYLAETYKGLFDENINLTPFTDKKLQRHHVIPLGSIHTLVKTSAENLRKDKRHILNSPVNFIYVTEEENQTISYQSLEDYQNKIITKSSLSDLSFSNYKQCHEFLEEKDQIRAILEDRFDSLQSKIISKINKLIPS